MKKLLMTILVICLAALVCVSVVACNPDTANTPEEEEKPNNYEIAKYTVTFDSDGGIALDNPVITGVEYGSYIQKPLGEDGKEFKPTKTGYDFEYWMKDSKEFNFATTPITSNTILKAKYKAKSYPHDVDLTKGVVYDAATDTFKLEDVRAEGDIRLDTADEIEATTTIKSTYGGSTDLNSPILSDTLKEEGEKFCFWYYVEEKDGKLQPVQFTAWSKDDEKVSMLAKYAFTKKLTLYAMLDSDLPEVSVEFNDDPELSALNYVTRKYRFGREIMASEAAEINNLVRKNGYVFDYWYYNEVDEKDETVITPKRYTFYEPETTSTKLLEAVEEAGNPADNFKPVTLKLYAKWTKEIRIENVNDYMTLLDDIRNGSEKDVERILTANIYISGALNFGDTKLEPLFDKEHIFTGVIDGGIYSGEDVECNVIRGGLFGNSEHASVFGYSNGTIKNIKFEDIGLAIDEQEEDGYAVNTYIGGVATVNGGTISNCEISFNENMGFDSLHTVVFGGIAAINRAIEKEGITGIITDCRVTLNNLAIDCEALTLGGIAGEGNGLSHVLFSTATLNIAEVNCVDDGASENGSSKLTLGGLVAANGGEIQCSTANVSIGAMNSVTEFAFGGVAGTNMGKIKKTDANVTLCSASAPAKVGGSILKVTCVGGLVGNNKGSLENCYSVANLYVEAVLAPSSGSVVYVGGLAGSNFSDSTDSEGKATEGIGAVNYCYSAGEIVVKVKEGVSNVSVYAGGIAGKYKRSSKDVVKIGTVFTLMDVSVSNTGKSYLGYLFGEKETNSQINAKCFYAEDIELTLNGKVYGVDDDIDDATFTTVGTATERDNFYSSDWTVGGVAPELGFSALIWEVEDGDLPTFIEPRTKV